ncbi:MAG: glucose 1-dehydrogenase [Chloroflexi bacterium]|nr:glucose 1-dehydrogenase [Chloroflexota bacterium]
MELEGQAALVTGGASGIGGAICRTLAAGGANVLVADVDEGAAAKVAAQCEGRASAFRMDASVPADAAAAVAACAERYGACTILVHSAAPPDRHGPILEMLPERWGKVLDVILTGGYLAAVEFSKQVQRQGKGGSIVNIVSTVVESPRVNSAAYCSAKSGLVALTRVLAMELAPLGIRVNAVGPGLTQTPRMLSTNKQEYNTAFLKQVPLGRLGESQDIANAVRFLVSPAASYISGQSLYVDGGYGAGKLSVQA